MYLPIMEQMLRAGYGVFSWDKPGTGESTGDIDPYHVISERAQILLDAIEVMKAHPDIDPQQTFETYDEYVHKCKGNRSVLPPSFVFTISQPGR